MSDDLSTKMNLMEHSIILLLEKYTFLSFFSFYWVWHFQFDVVVSSYYMCPSSKIFLVYCTTVTEWLPNCS